MIATPYVPKFRRVTAAERAVDRWNLADDPEPRHVQMMRAIRRLPGQEMTLADARAACAESRARADALDLTRWQRLAWENGIEVHHA